MLEPLLLLLLFSIIGWAKTIAWEVFHFKCIYLWLGTGCINFRVSIGTWVCRTAYMPHKLHQDIVWRMLFSLHTNGIE